MKTPSFDNVKVFAFVAGGLLLGYAAWRVYKLGGSVTDQVSQTVSNSLTGIQNAFREGVGNAGALISGSWNPPYPEAAPVRDAMARSIADAQEEESRMRIPAYEDGGAISTNFGA